MPEREVRYCTTEDGVRIAYCVEGEGPPLVACPAFVASFSLDHLLPPYWKAFLDRIRQGRRLVRYDMRGTGLSQRDATDFSGPALVRDIDAVVRAARLKRFALWGTSLSGPRAIAYAAQYPERVTHLILFDTVARAADAADAVPYEAAKALAELARTNWKLAVQTLSGVGAAREEADPSKRQVYSEWLLQVARINQQSTEGEVAASLILEAYESWDVGHLLGQIRAKTLVFHHLDNLTFPVSVGRQLAADIPGAVFVPLEGVSLPWAHPEQTATFVSTLNRFLGEGRRAKGGASAGWAVASKAEAGVTRLAPPATFAGGRYAVKRLLGEGAQKVVYLVRDTALERDCALALLKIEGMDSESLKRFRREAQAMARLTHPNIVTVHDIGEEEGRPYIVCEYVAGGDLRQELGQAKGPLPLGRALSIAKDLCRALALAHGENVVHRDVKPGNV